MKAVIFDFDGTLVDSSRSIVSTFNAVLSHYGVPEWDEDRIRKGIGRPLMELFHEIFANGQPTPQHLVETYVRLSQKNGYEEVKLLPGVLETLDHFSGRVSLGIATSRTSGSTRAILQRFKLGRRFGAIVGIDMVQNPKPHPEPVAQVLKALGVEPRHALLVGDTPDDIHAARGAEVLPVGVTTGAHPRQTLEAAGASAVIDDLLELQGLMR